MTRLFTAILAALLAILALPAGAAETIRVCSDDQPHPPFYFPDREGTVQVLLRMAAARAGVEIQIVPMPVRRCEAEIQNGGADAIAVAEFESQALKRYVFPLRNGRADPAKSVASTSALVFRSKGSSASWDGRRFTNLNGPVLVQTGHVFITRRLESMHIPFDSGAAAAEQNFLKLIGKRQKNKWTLFFQTEGPFASNPALLIGKEFWFTFKITDSGFSSITNKSYLPSSGEMLFFKEPL